MSRRRFLHIEAPRPGQDAGDGAAPNRTTFEELASSGAEASPEPVRPRFDHLMQSASDVADFLAEGGPPPGDVAALATTEPRFPLLRTLAEDHEHNERLAAAASRTKTDERFDPAPPPLAVAERDRESLPFHRCAGCGVDSNRFSTNCQHCGAELGTEAQRAFQAQVLAQLRQSADLEAEQSAAFAQAQEELAQQTTEARRAFAEALARSTGQRERARLGVDADAPVSPGRWILERIPGPWRKRVLLGAGGLVVTCLVIGQFVPALRPRNLAIGAVLVAVWLFVPPSRRWPRRWW